MTDKEPQGFKDLPVEELRRTAIEDFAVTTDPKANQADILALLLENGNTFDEYLNLADMRADAFASEVEEESVVAPVAPSASVNVRPNIITAASPVIDQNSLYLVIMDTRKRQNPLFEIAGHRFTQENPYALVNAQAAEVILNEDGFRQATPRELKEYYS